MKQPAYRTSFQWTFVLATSYIVSWILDKSVYYLLGLTYWAIHFFHNFIPFLLLYVVTRFKIFGDNNYGEQKQSILSNDNAGPSVSIICKLVVTQSLVSVCTCLVHQHGFENAENYIRVTDFVTFLAILYLFRRFSKVKFFADKKLAAFLSVTAICSSVAYTNEITLEKFVIIVWSIVPLATAYHYFIAFNLCIKGNISFLRLAMLICGWSSIVLAPFALLLTSDKYLNDQKESIEVPIEHFHYIAAIGDIVFCCAYVIAKYWLIFNSLPRTYINVNFIIYNIVIYFQWMFAGFANVSPFHALANILATVSLLSFCRQNVNYIDHEEVTILDF